MHITKMVRYSMAKVFRFCVPRGEAANFIRRRAFETTNFIRTSSDRVKTPTLGRTAATGCHGRRRGAMAGR